MQLKLNQRSTFHIHNFEHLYFSVSLSLFYQISLKTGQVTTIAGNGKQGSDKEGGKLGTLQSISSPWDVVVGPPPGLYIILHYTRVHSY